MELAVISPYTLQPHNHPNPRRYSHSHHSPHPHRHHHHARSAKVNCWPWFRARGCPWVLGYCSHFHCWLCHRHHHPVFDETKKIVRFRDLCGTKLFQTTFFRYKHYPRPILRLFRYYFVDPFRSGRTYRLLSLYSSQSPFQFHQKMERSKEREVLRLGRLTHHDHGDHNNHDDHHCQWTTSESARQVALGLIELLIAQLKHMHDHHPDLNDHHHPDDDHHIIIVIIIYWTIIIWMVTIKCWPGPKRSIVLTEIYSKFAKPSIQILSVKHDLTFSTIQSLLSSDFSSI